MTFRHNFAYLINSFVVCHLSLDITVMINILWKIIKIMHKKMLKAINFYWFENNTSERNNFTKWLFQRTSNKWIEVCHTSCQIKSCWYNSLFLQYKAKLRVWKNGYLMIPWFKLPYYKALIPRKITIYQINHINQIKQEFNPNFAN